MAEVAQSRPAASRGRSSGRAGRGGFASRGGGRSGGRSSATDSAAATAATATSSGPSLDEQGELGQLKKQYMSQLDTLKELFPDWTDDDLVFALEETDGDLQRTIERITEGNVSQFADVKKKTKEKSRAKKETPAATESHPAPTRGRGRGGLESGRGGRGRGSERGGRGRGRGAATSSTNGPRAVSSAVSVPTTESTGWGEGQANTETWPQPEPAASTSNAWEQHTATAAALEPSTDRWGDSPPTKASEAQKSSLIPEGSKKSWASMLAQPKAPPPIPKATTAAAHPATTLPVEPMAHAQLSEAPALQHKADVLASVDQPGSFRDVSAVLSPPQDQLTEDNLESLPDESVPAPTDTVASTRDAGSTVGPGTPYGSSQPNPSASRPPIGGFATTAWKATGAPGRSASYQRRMMEQREAVVMPGNHAVDRAAVQFGSMGLNGENRPVDIDEDREEAQTRAQPQQSPPSQPRASLPPAPRQPAIPEQHTIHDGIPTPKQAPGLPQPPSLPGAQVPLAQQSLNQPGSQANQAYGQYGRFASGSLGQESGAPAQKQYDAFSQQLNYSPSQQENQGMYPAHTQASNPLPTQAQHGAFSQAPSDFGTQYATDQQRNPYQNFYGSSYGHQNVSAQQDQNAPPQRSGSGFAAADSGYGSSHTNAVQSRFSDAQNSGQTTPNPAMVSQSQQGQQQHIQHQQPPGQAGHGGNYPYANAYYGGGSYYSSYMNQYPSNYYNQQGYGAPFGGKGNMYGQPHHGYGISPQTSYEHSSSPANAQAFGSSGSQGRDGGMAGGLGDYGRSGSAQPAQPNVSSAGAFSGSANEGFGRNTAGFSHNQQYGQQQGEDALKAFNETKAGPSPSLGQPGRAGSAASSGAYGANQSNYPPQQTHQQGFGGYASHGSQYGSGLGGLGAHQGNAQSHQGSNYGGYGSGFGSNTYGSYGRGGWGGNYGH